MSAALFVIHVCCAGVWLGCIATEALFERALLGKGRTQEMILAELHKRVDLAVEAPAFVLLLLTGAAMLATAAPDALLHAKIGLGAVAVAANLYCIWLVFRRAAAARAGRWDAFARLDHRQHVYGAVVLAGVVLALAAGFARAAL